LLLIKKENSLATLVQLQGKYHLIGVFYKKNQAKAGQGSVIHGGILDTEFDLALEALLKDYKA